MFFKILRNIRFKWLTFILQSSASRANSFTNYFTRWFEFTKIFAYELLCKNSNWKRKKARKWLLISIRFRISSINFIAQYQGYVRIRMLSNFIFIFWCYWKWYIFGNSPYSNRLHKRIPRLNQIDDRIGINSIDGAAIKYDQ